MKKRYKVLAVFVAVVLVMCCCCIPASAATINAGTGSQVYVGWDSNAGPVISGNKNANGSYWINYYAGRTDIELGILYPIDLVINRGDIVKWSSFYGNYYFSLSYTPTISIILGLMDENYNFYDLEVIPADDDFLDGSFDVGFKGGSTQFTEDLNAKYICIMLNGTYNQTAGGTFSWHPYSFKLSSADENTIMIEGMISEQEKTNELLGDITADKYNPPSGTDKMDELTAKEEAVNQKAQQGMNEAGNMFKAFSLDPFSDGLIGAVQLFNRITPNMPWLNQLLTVSLALGLFAFLVGMAQAYIGRLNSNDRQARTEQYRQARLKQGKGGK